MTPLQAWTLARRSVEAWSDDEAPSMGAALAYYTLFSLAPLLLIVTSVAGLVFGADAARGRIFGELGGLLGAGGAAAVQSLLESIARPARGIVATAVGALLMLVGATTVFAELQRALDRIWRAPAPVHGGLLLQLRRRLVSFGLILGVGFLLLVSQMLGAALAALQAWWSPSTGPLPALVPLANFALGVALATTLFVLIYKTMPRVQLAWSDVWIGAFVTAALFTVGRYAIGLYIERSAIVSAFGAAGSLVAVLVWVYYSAQIFLLGAEFTRQYAHSFGSRRGVPLEAETGASGAGVASYSDRPHRPTPGSDARR